jgi:putative endonuclease
MDEADSPQSLGRWGETLARRELERLGYAILATRYRTRYGEIDIVGRDGSTVVFVEVKARRTSRCGTAVDAVSPLKRRRLAAMALDYLAGTGRLDSPCRFDIIAIDGVGSSDMRLRLIRDAFHVDS